MKVSSDFFFLGIGQSQIRILKQSFKIHPWVDLRENKTDQNKGKI